MKLFYCGYGWQSIIDFLERGLPAEHTLQRWDNVTPLAEAVREAEVLLPSNARVDATVLRAATGLRLVQQPAVGTDTIDLVTARELGIPVCNSPGANHVAVAEAALLLLLALLRRLPEAQRAFSAGVLGAPLGRQLAGLTLGILGPGRSGGALADRARALGMRVISSGRTATSAERAEFFGQCDVLSLHCPLTAATRGLIDERALAQMKPGVLLINVSRGPVVDRSAVLVGLQRGVVGGLGLDVHWGSPWDPADEIYHHPKVVALPHLGGCTEESCAVLLELLLENLRRLDTGEPLLHQVNA